MKQQKLNKEKLEIFLLKKANTIENHIMKKIMDDNIELMKKYKMI